MPGFHRKITIKNEKNLISLIPVEIYDLKFINDIRNNESTRKNLNNTKEISLSDTQIWFEREQPLWFIIEIDNTRVGYIRTSLDTGESICVGCDIHPDYRNLGYASSAYKILIDHLYESNYVVIWLEVFKANLIAQNLYKKLGFLEINTTLKGGRESLTMVHAKNLMNV